MKRSLLVVGLLGLLLASAFGQNSFMQAKIPFEFVVEGKTLPAGDYDFKVTDRLVQLKNHDTGNTVALGYLTRIAVDKSAPAAARISFDVQDNKHFIEAIWPAKDDGYLVHMVKGEHTHDIVAMQ